LQEFVVQGLPENAAHHPVMYLGQYTQAVLNENALNAGPAAQRYVATNLAEWQGNFEREVEPRDFTGRDLHAGMNRTSIVNVFPMESTNSMRMEDMLAITSSINAQDCLIAFAQIMFKRFFYNEPLTFVETGGWEGKGKMNRANQHAAPLLPAGGANITRTALTSNDYPYFKHGAQETMTVQRHWEIVMIRPNIEHNMLGVILGRGGINELGATFWGQTELSCYDDSMHGPFLFFVLFSLCLGCFCASCTSLQLPFHDQI
jgi:hypothetical protein